MHVRSSAAAALIASVLLHAGVGVSLYPERAASPRVPQDPSHDVVAPHTRSAEGARAPRATQPLVPGSAMAPTNIDTDSAEGESAELGGSLIWIQSLPSASAITLRDADLNNAWASQIQRIDTSLSRATQEDRRATPHPAERVFLASGVRGPNERLPEARRWPEPGAVTARGLPAPPATDDSDGPEALLAQAGPPAHGAHEATIAREAGSLRSAGTMSQHRAPRAQARPPVDPGHAATPATLRSPAIRDSEAAELLAASLQRSIVDATRTRRDRADAEGMGASEHGLAGLGRVQKGGAGSHADVLKPGAGDLGLLDTRDSRYVHWFGQQRARVAEHLAFPRQRALTMDQGQTLVFVRVLRSGAFVSNPALYRSSGYAEFDAAALSAVRDTGGFSPLPDEISPGSPVLSLLLPVRFDNPMVR